MAVVVDSAASLPFGAAKLRGLQVVPMQLTFDGRTYLDGRDLAPTDFYRMLRNMAGPPTTAAPSPAAFLEAFRSASDLVSSVLCLTVSPSLSATHDSAFAAARQAMEEIPGFEVRVVDTESAAGGEGLVATAAWRAAAGGATLEQVASAAGRVIVGVSLLAFLDTLYYVWKGGRVPRLAYAGASLLRIKPMMELVGGKVRNVGRPRTAARASDRMLRVVRERAGSRVLHASVMHADAADSAERLRERVRSEFQCEELFVSEFSPVMGAHTGPGLLGIAFWAEPEERDSPWR